MTLKVYIRATKTGSHEELPDALKKIKELVKDIPGVIIQVNDVKKEKEEAKK